MTPPETGPVTTVPAPTTATAPQEGPRATSTLSRRGFAIRRVPTMRLADGPDGEYRYNRWMHFAGVDSTRVQVRGERVLYTAAGVILGGYTVYAFIGVFAFAQMAVDRLWVAIAAAAVIGTILIAVNLSIDRGLIGYVPAQLDDVEKAEADAQPLLEDNKVKWARRLRVILAILFALAVGEPANLFLFGKDVDAAMVERDQRVVQSQRDVSERNYEGQIAAQEAILDTATQRIDEISRQADDLVKKAEAERAGTGATGELGCGSQCREYLASADAARAAAPALIAAETAKINTANAEIAHLNGLKNNEAKGAAVNSAANNGFLAREQALLSAMKEDPVLLFRYLVIVAVFFCLEMGAVLTKYLAKGNNYERESARRARLAEFASLVRARNERATISHRGDLNRRLAVAADEHFYADRSADYAPTDAAEAPSAHRSMDRSGDRTVELPTSDGAAAGTDRPSA